MLTNNSKAFHDTNKCFLKVAEQSHNM